MTAPVATFLVRVVVRRGEDLREDEDLPEPTNDEVENAVAKALDDLVPMGAVSVSSERVDI